jgi:hypothetical protein
MLRRIFVLFRLLGFTVGVIVAWRSNTCWGAGRPNPLPPFDQVKKTVEEHFQRRPDYQPGDIISRGDVAPLLAQLAAIGFPMADQEDILSDVPGDGEFLVGTLRTTAGRKFMRRIAALPNTYDRLDQLSRLPHGEQTVQDLIRGPHGDELLKYLTTTRGGTAMGKQLSNARAAADFSKPTGRIYTVAALLLRLQKSYAAASRRSGSAK